MWRTVGTQEMSGPTHEEAVWQNTRNVGSEVSPPEPEAPCCSCKLGTSGQGSWPREACKSSPTGGTQPRRPPPWGGFRD